MNEHIIVYGDFTLDLKKYPRIGTTKEKTDIIIITFLMHEEYLTKCAKSLDDAIKYFNGCKEYSYTYNSPDNVVKRYSAKEIIQIHNMISNNNIRNNNDYYNFMKNFQYIDQSYISYLKCRDFYMNLFKSIKNAKDAHFERRDYFYKVIPPMEIYGHMNNIISGQIYSAYELMELFTFTHYLKNRNIIKTLPIPSFVSKINEEHNSKYMTNLINSENIKNQILKENNKKRINIIRKKDKNIETETYYNMEEEDEEEHSKEDYENKINYNTYFQNNTFESKNRITHTSLWDSKNENILN